VINVVIEPQAGLATINVRFDDSVSSDELRAAWEEVLSGVLQHHIRDAIWFECVKRGLDPHEIVTEPPPLN
jgi:Mor family transcriptional regulator